MATAYRKCKICGNNYEYCHTLYRDPNVFRWQDVACCVEHGQEYLALVLASRAPKQEAEEAVAQNVEAVSDEAEKEDVVVERPKKAKVKPE